MPIKYHQEHSRSPFFNSLLEQHRGVLGLVGQRPNKEIEYSAIEALPGSNAPKKLEILFYKGFKFTVLNVPSKVKHSIRVKLEDRGLEFTDEVFNSLIPGENLLGKKVPKKTEPKPVFAKDIVPGSIIGLNKSSLTVINLLKETKDGETIDFKSVLQVTNGNQRSARSVIIFLWKKGVRIVVPGFRLPAKYKSKTKQRSKSAKQKPNPNREILAVESKSPQKSGSQYPVSREIPIPKNIEALLKSKRFTAPEKKFVETPQLRRAKALENHYAVVEDMIRAKLKQSGKSTSVLNVSNYLKSVEKGLGMRKFATLDLRYLKARQIMVQILKAPKM